MNIINTTLALPAIIIATASPALADFSGSEEHFDVWIQQNGTSLFTGSISEDGDPLDSIWRVFGAEFGEEPTEPFAADEPGFQANDGHFDPFFNLRIDIAGPVERWNGNGFSTAAETITLAFGPSSVTSSDGFVEGFDFAMDDQGGFHNHFEIILNSGSLSGDPADGIYLLPLQLASALGSLNSSETFWFVMNLNMDETTHDEATEWVETNLVPAPGGLALLALSSLLGLRSRRRTNHHQT